MASDDRVEHDQHEEDDDQLLVRAGVAHHAPYRARRQLHRGDAGVAHHAAHARAVHHDRTCFDIRLFVEHAFQHPCQLLLLGRGELAEQLLGLGHAQRVHAVEEIAPGRGDGEPDRATIRRIGSTLDETGRLERVDHRRGRTRDDVELVGEVGHPQRLRRARDDPEHPRLRVGDPDRLELLGRAAAHAPRGAGDELGEPGHGVVHEGVVHEPRILPIEPHYEERSAIPRVRPQPAVGAQRACLAARRRAPRRAPG